VVCIPKTIDNDIMWIDNRSASRRLFAEAVKAVKCSFIEATGGKWDRQSRLDGSRLGVHRVLLRAGGG
jgi:hypothetical protein